MNYSTDYKGNNMSSETIAMQLKQHKAYKIMKVVFIYSD